MMMQNSTYAATTSAAPQAYFRTRVSQGIVALAITVGAPPDSDLRRGRRAAILAVVGLIAVLTPCVLASPSSAALPPPGGAPLPTGNQAPVGDLELVQRVPAGVRVKGWITDPDLPGQAIT